jgi:hypothetical protein
MFAGEGGWQRMPPPVYVKGNAGFSRTALPI